MAICHITLKRERTSVGLKKNILHLRQKLEAGLASSKILEQK